MKRILVTLLGALLFGATPAALAQQDAQFSQYMFNQLFYNPAAAGSDTSFVQMNVFHRIQWLGYSPTFDDGGAPVSTLASVSLPLNKLKSGIGLQWGNDRLGALTNNEVLLSYAYRLPVKNYGTLSIGLRGGVYNQAVDFAKFRPNDPEDPILVSKGKVNQFVPDFAAGLYFTARKYYIGVSYNHLVKSSFDYGTKIEVNPLENNFNVLAGLNLDLSTDWQISPSLVARTNFRNVFSAQASILATWQSKFYAGISARDVGPLSDAVLLIGANLTKSKALSVGYAFDYVIAGVNAKAATSHEIRLGYKIAAPKKAERFIIRTPRFRHE
jgi:type IX secretion system PorP/SprF family membrane protein